MKIVNFLTDATKGRYNPVIENLINFDQRAKKFNADVEELRSILGTKNSANDFALQTALVVANAYPEILKEMDSPNLIGVIASYIKGTNSITAGRVVPINNQFSMFFKPGKLYKDTNLHIKYKDEQYLELSIEEDKWVTTYDLNLDMLKIDFPEELNSLKFMVELNCNWDAAAEVVIGLVPNSYPFKKVINDLANSHSFIKLANKIGRFDSFDSHLELPYKLAIAVLVLYKSHEELV